MSTRISEILETGFLIEEEAEFKILNDDIVICFGSTFKTHSAIKQYIIDRYKASAAINGTFQNDLLETYRDLFDRITKAFSDLKSYAQKKYPNFNPPIISQLPFELQ